MAWTDDLHATLDRRATPEYVAQIIRGGGVAACWPAAGVIELGRVASAHARWWVSSMPDDFERAGDCRLQLVAVGRMFGVDVSHVGPADAEGIRALISGLGERAGGWKPGDDWKRDRLSKAERRSGVRDVDGAYVAGAGGGASATVTLAAVYSGEPGLVHGGIQAVILDEVMGRAAQQAAIEHAGQRHVVVTAEFELRYRAPCRTGEPVTAYGRVDRIEWPSVFAAGTLTDSTGQLLTEAKARWRVLT